MRKRLFWMILCISVPIFFLMAWYMSEQSFQQSLQKEKERTQLTEAFIFGDVQSTTSPLPYASVLDAARQYQHAYASQGIELILCWNDLPLAGAELPNEHYHQLLSGSRSAMLSEQRYAISDPVSDHLVMILIKDLRDLYQLRDQFRLTALLAALAASFLMAGLGFVIAGVFTKPIHSLTKDAQEVARGTGGTTILPVYRRDEIGQLARAFAEMKEAVNQREQALREESDSRKRMLEALAHEMRTPLTSLLGNARLLQRDLPLAERRPIAESMVRDVQRLAGLDEQLMKLMTLRSDELEWEMLDILELLQDTAARLQIQNPDIRIQVTGEQTWAEGDRMLLSLLADNLTANAMHASQPGQRIWLTAGKDGFSVRDEGIGMTAEQIQRACEPFWKADKARTRRHGGAGLGLSLCHRIAEMHHGSLVFQSAPGEGTTVTFTGLLQSDGDFVTG